MLLTISKPRTPATGLGYLLHKHPDRCQSFVLAFGKAHVFYPTAGGDRCMAALLLDEDPTVGAPIPVPNTCGASGSGASAAMIMSQCIVGFGHFRRHWKN